MVAFELRRSIGPRRSRSKIYTLTFDVEARFPLGIFIFSGVAFESHLSNVQIPFRNILGRGYLYWHQNGRKFGHQYFFLE